MNNLSVEEGNKLIAVFDGGKIEDDVFGHTKRNIFFAERKMELHLYHADNLKYHLSWDWLMPVVEKINTLAIDNVGEIGVWIFPYQCSIGENTFEPLTMTTIANHPKLIDMVYTAVLTFIKWYNNQKIKV